MTEKPPLILEEMMNKIDITKCILKFIYEDPKTRKEILLNLSDNSLIISDDELSDILSELNSQRLIIKRLGDIVDYEITDNGLVESAKMEGLIPKNNMMSKGFQVMIEGFILFSLEDSSKTYEEIKRIVFNENSIEIKEDTFNSLLLELDIKKLLICRLGDVVDYKILDHGKKVLLEFKRKNSLWE